MIFRAILSLGTTLNKFNILDSRVTGVGSNDDIGEGENHGVVDFGGFDSGRDE